MILFAAYITAETLNAFQWAGQPQYCPFACRDLAPYLIHSSLVYKSQPPPNGISISSVIFAQHIRVTNTDRQTDTQTDMQYGLIIIMIKNDKTFVQHYVVPGYRGTDDININ